MTTGVGPALGSAGEFAWLCCGLDVSRLRIRAKAARKITPPRSMTEFHKGFLMSIASLIPAVSLRTTLLAIHDVPSASSLNCSSALPRGTSGVAQLRPPVTCGNDRF